MNIYSQLTLISDLWVLHGLYSAVIGRAEGGKTDEHIHFWMFLHCISHVLIDRQQNLLMAPVKLLLMVSTDLKQQ